MEQHHYKYFTCLPDHQKKYLRFLSLFYSFESRLTDMVVFGCAEGEGPGEWCMGSYFYGLVLEKSNTTKSSFSAVFLIYSDVLSFFSGMVMNRDKG